MAAPAGWLGFAQHNPACCSTMPECPVAHEAKYKAINISGHAHELTFSCYGRFPFLKAERTCLWLADALQAARIKHAFDLWAFVFMPEHVHLIIRPRHADDAMRKIMAGIKLPVARVAIHFLENTNSPWLSRITR